MPAGKRGEPESPAARLNRELLSDEAIDEQLTEAGDGALRLTGEGGFLPEVIRRVLERGMAAELTDHLGYDRHERAGRVAAEGVNYRNGSTPKGVATEFGDVTRDIPREQTCAHVNACLTWPMFVTTPEFLPQHCGHRQQILQIISAAEARGQNRLIEMNQQVLTNLNRIITTLDDGRRGAQGRDRGGRCELTTPTTPSPPHAAGPTPPTGRQVAALRRMDSTGIDLTFDAVARKADVSRSWLYTQPDLRAEIQRLRERKRPGGHRRVPDR